MRDDPLRAFCQHPTPAIDGADNGPLHGLTFAAKDMFAVEGWRCCSGHPAWLASHDAATCTAESVSRSLAAGASLIGKTQMGALAFDASGVNPHYGTPINPRASKRVPGGSSSGSAVAVASGMVEFALGTDSACSVRLPASYCGLFGIRPSFGRVPTDGVIPLSPGIDTVGWFARQGEILRDVGQVLLNRPETSAEPLSKLLIATDAFELCSPEAQAALQKSVALLGERFESVEECRVMRESDDPLLVMVWYHADRIQRWQVRQQHDAWLEEHEPEYGSGSWDSIKAASAVEARESEEVRARVRKRLNGLLEGGGVLCLPTASGPAPFLDATREVTRPQTWASLVLCSIAVLGQLSQISLPGTEVDGAPIGLSLIGAWGSDERLLDLAAELPSVEASHA